MNRFPLLFLLLALSSSGIRAQTPGVYFDSTSFWGHFESFGTPNFPGSCLHQIENYWNIDGDSVALGQTWYKLYNTRRYQLDCTYPTTHSETKHADQYAGLLRQEGREIRMVFPGAAYDTVIYNFNRLPGDAFFPGLAVSGANTIATLTPFAGDTTRLVFDSEAQMPSWGNQWIEGIGATRGPVFGPAPVDCYSIDCLRVGRLNCYSMQNDEFGFVECPQARAKYQAIVDAVSATPEPGRPARAWLAPNPGREELAVYVSGLEAVEIHVRDATGNLVLRRSDLSPVSEVIELHAAALPAGPYWVIVYGKNASVTLKWLKI
jgi:hypothetical protein